MMARRPVLATCPTLSLILQSRHAEARPLIEAAYEILESSEQAPDLQRHECAAKYRDAA